MFGNWPVGTFSWLSQVFTAANSLGLFAEGRVVIDLICVVAPHYRGRDLLEATSLAHEGRYQEASERVIESLHGDEQNTFKRYLLYFCLRQLSDPEWVQHAQALAESPDEELSQRARLDLGLPEESAPSLASAAAMGFDRPLVRV